jgi:pimeloyl-ACP methyl ester carboxylesterase
LRTKDGVLIHARYFAGLHGKETVPIIMLHGWGGRGSDLYVVAARLQSPQLGGHAVIVPDLRGHGRSTLVKPLGSDDSFELDPSRFRRAEIETMMLDIESVKKYLMERNNEGNLNIDMLCVVGAEFGGLLAVNWSALDWSWPPVAGLRQGQDVKAVVLISPHQGYKGFTSQQALTTAAWRRYMSVLILYGEDDSKSASAARRIHGGIKRFRTQDWSEEERASRQDLWLVGLGTSLQGTELLGERQLEQQVAAAIADFIDRRLTQRKDNFPWIRRERPLN